MLLKRLAVLWRALRFEGRVMWQVVKHPLTPLWIKVASVAPLLYVFFPFDVLPDIIPFMGYLDDALVIAFIPKIWSWLIKRSHPEVQEVASRQAGARPVESTNQ